MGILRSLVIFLHLIFLFAIQGFPQDVEETETEKDWEDWHFNASSYFWFIGFNGTLITPPLPSNQPELEQKEIDIDIGFKEIRNSIKYAMMFSGQYRNEHISVVMNYSHLILQGEAITPFELVIQGIDTKFRHVSGDLSVQYRIVKTAKWNIDAGLGVKFLSDKVEAVVNLPVATSIDLARSESWIDPMISTFIKYIPHPKFEIAAYFDYGSGLIGDISYQTIGGLIYRFTPVFNMSVGHRVWGVESDLDKAVFKGNINGWVTRVGFRF